ncbi:MAG: adenine methyltransferase [Hydrotalea flava]|nr:adenine methyltransferase [Hydrotalea flava]NIN15393.1 adenine methyltransferase [Hydrotalea flava]
MKKAVQHLSQINIQDDYETPTPLYNWACRHFKVKPVIDVCGSKKHHKTPTYFVKDALKEQWNKPFWCNPPYSKVNEFIKYAYEQHLKHNVNGLILVYAKVDTRWFHKYVQGKAEIYFIKGRVKFWINGKETKHPSPYPSMIICYRKSKPKTKRLGMID